VTDRTTAARATDAGATDARATDAGATDARAAADRDPGPARPVRRLTPADLPAIVRLAADRGWPPEESKWRLLFAVSEPFGVDDPDGGLAGAVVLTRHGPALAAVGMMLVASRQGRKGLGGRLLQHALARAGDAIVYLTATGYGRPLYERHGFRALDTSVTYRGQLRRNSPDPGLPGASAGVARPDAALRPVTAADVADLRSVDAAVFGADRGRVLGVLPGFADAFLLRGSAAGGYGAAWRKDGTRVIGPVVAPDLDSATALIAGLAQGWSGPVRLDVLGRHPDLAAWALASGLTAGEETTLMVRGSGLPGDRARLYCPVTVAIG
jgi:GNAT superfamily N-acetyltransferase